MLFKNHFKAYTCSVKMFLVHCIKFENTEIIELKMKHFQI